MKNIPNKTILDDDTNSFPRNLTLDEYAVARVQSELGDTSQERITAVIQGLMARSYYELAIGQDDRYAGFKLLARKVYQTLSARRSARCTSNLERVGLPPYDVLESHCAERPARSAKTGTALRRARRHPHPARHAGGSQCDPAGNQFRPTQSACSSAVTNRRGNRQRTIRFRWMCMTGRPGRFARLLHSKTLLIFSVCDEEKFQ